MKQFSREFFKSIPNLPGVYFMFGEGGEILYIGKAKRLRKRLSSYRQVKSGTHPGHLVELVGLVREIRWELHRTERKALERENELLHAVRPPYNIADTEEGSYLFVTMRKVGVGRYEFALTHEPDGRDDVMVFGCYRNFGSAKAGFGALLRLLYCVSFAGARFSIPARLRRPRRDENFVIAIDETSLPSLWAFLRGSSLGFLRSLTQGLIENERIPRFMGPSLQEDIDCTRRFFATGPKTTRALKRKNGFRARVLSHERMDELIRRSVADLVTPAFGAAHPRIQRLSNKSAPDVDAKPRIARVTDPTFRAGGL